MNKLHLTLEVARWEFTRFYKIKNELKGLVWLLAFGLVGGAIGLLIEHTSNTKPDLALINENVIPVDSTIYDQFNIQYSRMDEIDSVKALVDTGDIEAVVIIRSVDEGELYIRNERPWVLQLERLFTEYRRQSIIVQSEIPETELSYILNSFEFEIAYHDEVAAEGRGIERTFVIAFIIAMLAAVGLGFGYQFTAITGEKQQRITEQIVSAISPQTWIDGKILGITAIGITTIVFYGSLILLGGLVISQYFGPGFLAPLAYVSIWKILVFLALSLLGVLLWNSFLAAIAATISDPNTSERTVLMFLPMIPIGFAFGALLDPDNIVIQMLGLFPLTSPSMLPVRMVLTDVYLWEILLAVVLLVITIGFFRKAAAKIFSFGMLMYGKEPGFKEMWRWIKEA